MKKIVVRLIFLILFFDGLVAYATEETQFHIVRSGFSADGNAITDVITIRGNMRASVMKAAQSCPPIRTSAAPPVYSRSINAQPAVQAPAEYSSAPYHRPSRYKTPPTNCCCCCCTCCP